MAIISKELLQELKQILREDYGLELKQEEVAEIANSLVGFFETLIKINHQTNLRKGVINHG